MCGIVGYYSISGLFSGSDLSTMNDVVTHRGPDAEGCYSDGFVGLGHRRLSIIDLSTNANQPMTSSCGRYTLVYNGEIYNFKEVAAQLQKEKSGFTFQTNSDTEVLLEAFACWGEKLIEKLNGMFAFAVYDNVREELLLCRDRIGIKPLYYYWDGKNFLFSSELKSIKVLKRKIDLTINPIAINEYLHLGYIPQPNTIYKFVNKFPSGSILRVKDHNITFSTYWNPNEKIADVVIKDESDAKQELKSLLEKSVEARMVSDVPFGTFLSGGVDSSLVTAIAQKHSVQPINTFSIGFEESKHNESDYAKRVAEFLKTNHNELVVTEKEAMGLVGDLQEIYDEPFADGSMIPTILVSKLASKHVKMTLSGDGGDELFMGYGAYNWAKRFSNPYFRVLRRPVALGFDKLSAKYKRIGGLLRYADKKTLKSHIFSQEQYWFSRGEIKELIKPNYYTSFELDENFSDLSRMLLPEEQQALFDIKYYLKDDLLVKVDRATMFNSLETRVPLLDHNIVEFALNLSSSLKIRKGVNKYLLKEVLYEYLPKEMFDRPKWGFSVPLTKWLKGDLKYLVDEYLSENMINKHNVVNYKEVLKLKHDFLNKNVDYLYNRIWLLISLHQWLEINN